MLAAEVGTLGARMIELTRACSREVDSQLAAREGEVYSPLHTAFDEANGDQCLDHYGHLTEQANEIIAAAITDRLVPVLRDGPIATERGHASRGPAGARPPPTLASGSDTHE